jgi:hypothetical protein
MRAERQLWREPDAGNLHVRFAEGGDATVIGRGLSIRPPSLLYWLEVRALFRSGLRMIAWILRGHGVNWTD